MSIIFLLPLGTSVNLISSFTGDQCQFNFASFTEEQCRFTSPIAGSVLGISPLQFDISSPSLLNGFRVEV